MTSNSTPSFTDRIKQKRQAKEQEIAENLESELEQLEQIFTNELKTTEKSILARLRSVGTTIEKNINHLARQQKEMQRIGLFYASPFYLLAVGLIIMMYYFADTMLATKIYDLKKYHEAVKNIPAPGIEVRQNETVLQIQVSKKTNKEPRVWYHEESQRWIVEIERK